MLNVQFHPALMPYMFCEIFVKKAENNVLELFQKKQDRVKTASTF